MPEHDMTGRVALVTGGASGLGRAISRTFAAAGAHVVVGDIDHRGAADTVAEIHCEGGSADAVSLDVADPASVETVLAGIGERHGIAFDCLVNNAGSDRGSDMAQVTDTQWHSVFGVNLHGPMHTSRTFLQHVLAHGGRERPADILNICSISALTVGAGAAAYNSSKAALLKLTEVLQTEAREYGWPVRVTAIHPAAMRTPMMDQWSLPEERMMDPAIVAGLVRTAVTLPPEVVLQSATITLRNEEYPR